MGGKNLVITQGNQSRQVTTVANKNKQPTAMTKLDHIVERLLDSNESDSAANGTIEHILKHPQVKKHGLLGRLSSNQESLVTSVVSIMQDKVATDARRNAAALKEVIIHEREALLGMSNSFAETAKSLYKLPLINTTHSGSVPSSPSQGQPPRPPGFITRFLSWGNLLAISAIILTVLVIKTSVETANFETKFHASQTNLDQLNADHDALQKNFVGLQQENLQLSEANAALQARLEEKTHQLQEANDLVATERQRHLAAMAEQKQSQQTQLDLVDRRNQSLDKEITALQQELASAKGKEIQQNESDQIWKSLAEERKLEIDRLQAQVMDLTVTKTKEQKSGFLGIF